MLAIRSIQVRALLLVLIVTGTWAGAFAGTASHWWVGLPPILVSIVALILLNAWLRPISRAVRLLRGLEPDAPPPVGAEGRWLLAQTQSLIERLEALEHRWVRRLEAIDAHLRSDHAQCFVGAIRFADYKRLSAFDPDAAEAALKQFAVRLAASLGKRRLLAHVDRDCFAILFDGAAPDHARIEMSALSYAMSGEIECEGLALIPEVETGAAIYPDDADSPAGLLNQALVSLSRRGTVPATGSHAEDARERFVIAQGLRLAIERHELELNFQPVVDTADGVLVGAEALLRWRHPQVGLISPSRFVPILEDSDMTREIGLWALNAACKEVRGWADLGLPHLRIAVNLSARQLDDADLKPAIQRTLARHGLSPNLLEIELTETAAARDAERTRHLFRQLRALGVSIAIDDFGSGYSSLSYLKNLPFDKLKIDREFVSDVHLRRDSQAICRSIIELARGLGISVLAEGVEKVEEVDQLQRLGCRLFQGFYFGRPMRGDDFVQYALHPDGRAARRDTRGEQERLKQEMRG